MLHAAAAELQPTDPPIRKIVLLGSALSQIPLWYAPGAARFVVLWLLSIGLSVVCARLVPSPRRWLVGLGSLGSFLSVLSIDVRERVLWYGELEKAWFVIAPLLGVALVQIYLMLINRAVPLPDTGAFSDQAARLGPRTAIRRQRGLALLITLHALGLALYWAYSDHACTWFDLVRRVQGCAVGQGLPAFPAHTTEIQISPSGALVASAAPVTYTESLLLASPFTTENFEAFQQHIRTEATTISLWDLTTGQLLCTLDQPTRAFDIVVSPDDQLLATRGADDQLRIWSIADGRLLRTIADARFIAFSADGSLLATTTNDDPNIRLWSLRDGTLLRTMSLAEDVSFGVEMAFSPDGSLLAVRNNSVLALWRVGDGALHQTLATRQFPGPTQSLSFAPDGQTLATTGTYFGEGQGVGAVLLWRVADGTLLHALKVNQVISDEPSLARISTASFSPDGTRVAIGAREWPAPAVARIWRVADGALLEHIDGVVATDFVRLSVDGTSLQLYDSSRNYVRIYTQRIAQGR